MIKVGTKSEDRIKECFEQVRNTFEGNNMSWHWEKRVRWRKKKHFYEIEIILDPKWEIKKEKRVWKAVYGFRDWFEELVHS